MNQITLAKYLQSFLQPLAAAAADPVEEARLLARMGYAAPPGVAFLGSLAAVIEVGFDVAELLAEEEGSESGAAGRLVGDIIDAVQAVSNTVTNLQGSLSGGAAGSSLVTNTDFLETLPRKLFDLLFIDFLSREAPGTLGMLRVLSIVRLQPLEVIGDPDRVSHVSAYVAWERLPTLVSDPLGELKTYYGWGTPAGIDVPLLFESLRILAIAVGLRAEYRGIDPAARQMIDQAVGAAARVPQDGDPVLLRLPVFPIPNAEIGVDVYPIENTAGGAIAGLGLDAFADAAASITIQASDNVRLDAHLGGHVSGFGILIRPDEPVTIMTSASSGDPAAIFQNIALDADLGITFESSRGLPLVLLGTNGSTRLQVASMAAKVATKKAQASPDIDFLVEASVTKAAVVIQTSSSDGFLAKVLPKDGVSLEFDFMIGFSLQSGLYFGIGGGVELALPINFTLLDVFTIETAYLALRGHTANGKTRLTFAASALIKLAIGPLKATVEKMGVQAQLASGDEPGNLGPMNFAIGFKPPNGIGLKIEAEAVTGGGYLFFDFDEESYAGIAQVKIQDFIDIKLIGLLTTRLPELPPGQKGFSLLLIVAAEFSPITLAYGFTLNGVGGLIGINRTMMLEPLRAGVRTGAVNSILFPTDPVGRATQIISDLKTIFPPALNRFVLGPMIKIGWGASIITLEIGIIIEIPMPIRIAILGKITLALPTPDEAVAIIRMDILGTIDIARSDVSIDATLYDSRVLVFTITGDMSMRLNWGESPLFLISIGGFNPRFERPPGFPTLSRLAISLATGENPRLRFEKYMAVTSNSFQMGARFEVYASADLSVLGTFTACAYLGFDTFFQFDPFHFIAEIYGGADIQRNGASLMSAELRLTLDGPGPFRAVGVAALNFLGRHEVSFEAIAGEPQLPDAAPASQPLALLRAAFADAKNWTVLLPERQGVPVTLRERDPAGASVLHPFGGVRSRQTVVPLNTGIERFGNTAPDFLGPFVVDEVALKTPGGDPAATRTVKPARFVKEQFAPGQYFALSDEEKISRPSFELRDAGVELTWEQFEAGSAFAAGPAIATDWEYDTIEIDVASAARSAAAATIAPELAGQWLAGAAGRQSRLDEPGSARYVGTTQKLTVTDASYVLIDTATGGVTGAAAGVTYTDALAEKTAAGSGTAVVGQHEVALNV